MEGNRVYLCSWKKAGEKFRLWLKKRPEITVENLDFEEASEALAEKIGDFYQNRQAVLEFEPSPPAFHQSPANLEIISLGFNESVDALNVSPQLFSGGFCKDCQTAVGQRTNEQLELAEVPESDLVGIRNPLFPGRLFSQRFLSLLTREERSGFNFRAVKLQRSSRVEYFELLENPIASFIGVKGASYSPLSCWRCETCDSMRIFPKMPPGKLFRFQVFVCLKDFPKPFPSCFVVGRRGMLPRLSMLSKRWKQIVGKPGTKGIVTSPIGVIDEKQADYHPPLPIYRIL